MENKLKDLPVVELTKEELVEKNGGSERKDEKQSAIWETIYKYLKP